MDLKVGGDLRTVAAALRDTAGLSLLIRPEVAAVLDADSMLFRGLNSPISVTDFLNQVCAPHRRLDWIIRDGTIELAVDPLPLANAGAAAAFATLRHTEVPFDGQYLSFESIVASIKESTELDIECPPLDAAVTAFRLPIIAPPDSRPTTSAAEALSILCVQLGTRWTLEEGTVSISLPHEPRSASSKTLVLKGIDEVEVHRLETLVPLVTGFSAAKAAVHKIGADQFLVLGTARALRIAERIANALRQLQAEAENRDAGK